MKMSKEEARRHCDSHLKTLSDSLATGRSDGLQEYLAAMGRFHRYSFNNIMLILHQMPEATHVAGFHAWQKLGRQVRKGETGLAVIAPCPYKVKVEKDDGQKEDAVKIAGFKIAYVFDITQTEGEELPTFTALSGEPGAALSQLKAYIRELGIELAYVPSLGGGRLGQSAGGVITMKEGLDAGTEFAVLVHELAHEQLHHGQRQGQVDKSVRETEAEAVASVVCSAFGIDSTARSSDYISLYRGTPETLSESLGSIQRTAEKLIDGIQSADVDASDSCESPVTVSQPAESSCNHTLDCRDQAGTWGTSSTDDGRTKVVCVHCGRFYGYVDDDAADSPTLITACESQPDEQEAPEVLVTGRADYHERREERIERYRDRAERRISEADSTFQHAKRMADVIPFGQPILVGHHSEHRDRRYRERIHNTFGRSFELARKANYWEQRADAAESSHAISSDAPTALEQLREKLANLEHSQECMKAVNVAWRKAGKPEPTDVDGWARVAEFQDLVSADDLNRLRVEYAKLISWVAASAPFPSYSLSNNNAEIRRVRERIAELEASANAEHIESDRGVCRYVEDPEVNRVQLFFDGKPSDEIRKILKQNGFRFSKRNGNAWQRLLNEAGKRAADYVISQIQTLEAEKCPA